MVAKGVIRINKEELHELFNLPEGAEIVGVKAIDAGDGGFEFLVVSAEEIEKLTYKNNVGFCRIRRVPLQSEQSKKEVAEAVIKEIKDIQKRGLNHDA